jgi:hypothetical protein
MITNAAAIVIGLGMASSVGGTGATGTDAAAASEPPEQQPQPALACVRFWPLARYTAGYDHLVYVANGCNVAVSCAVWTDVNPVAQVVAIRPEQSIVVLTFRGSPARAFTAFVRCTASPTELQCGA